MNGNDLPFDVEQVRSLLEETLDELLEGFQIINTDWRYLYVNDTVARQGKRSKAQLIGRTMMECYPGIEDTEMFTRCKEAMETKKSVRLNNEFIYEDGSSRWFELLIRPVNCGLVILSLDITERKEAEDALVNKVDQVEMLLDATIDREMRVSELKTEVRELKILTSEVQHSIGS